MSSATPIIFTNNKLIDPLLGDYKWTGNNGATVITYSYPSAGAWWQLDYGDETNQWSGINEDQQAFFEKALTSWSDVANITFVKVPENNTSVGDIRVAFSQSVSDDGSYAWTYMPDGKIVEPYIGDIWLNSDNKNDDFSTGTDNYETFVHEIGHALGLDHPFDDETETPLLPSAVENYRYTTMSYTEHPGAGYYPGIPYIIGVAPSTPMLYDIRAIQYLYGANMKTRTGNDVYTFSNTQPEFKTIWDAGGIDTIDLSNQTLNESINLQAGEFSSIGKTYNEYEEPIAARQNIAIAYNVTIENAIGGAGKDTIIGNAGINILAGGNGNDTLKGLAGNDILIGGNGEDQLFGGLGKDSFKLLDKSKDLFSDFSVVDDKILLENTIFSALGMEGPLASGKFIKGAGLITAQQNDDYLIYNSNTGVLSYDADGNSPGMNPIPIAVIGNHAALTAANFVII